MMLGVSLLAGAVWLAFLYRVALANRALTYLEPYGITVGTVDLGLNGQVTGTDLVIKDQQGGEVLLKVPAFTIHPKWRELSTGNLGKVTLEQPQVKIHEGQLRQWMETSPSEPSADHASGAAPTPFRFAGIDIRDALIRLQMNDGTAAELKLNFHGIGLVRDAAGVVHSGTQRLLIEEGRVQSGHGEAPFAVKRLQLMGKVEDGVLKLSEVDIQDPALHLTPELMSLVHSHPSSDISKPGASFLRAVQAESVSVKGLSFSASGFERDNASGVLLPDIRAILHWETWDLRWSLEPDGGFHMGPQQGRVEGLAIETSGETESESEAESVDGSGHVRIPNVALETESMENFSRWRFKQLHFTKPDIAWTRALKERFLSKVETVHGEAPSDKVQSSEIPWEVVIDAGGIEGARIHLADDTLMPFHLTTDATLKVESLRVGHDGWQSSKPQTLTVNEGKLQFPPSAEKPEIALKPFFVLPHGELSMIPDRWNRERHVQKLVLHQPSLLMRDGNTPWLTKNNVAVQPTQETPVASEIPWWQKLYFDELTLVKGTSDLLLLAPEPVEARGEVNISTVEGAEGRVQRVRLDHVEARLPTLSRLPFPVAKFARFEGTVKLPELWSERRIESMKLEGANLEAGEALMGLIDSNEKAASSAPESGFQSQPKPPTEAKPVPGLPTQNGGPWHVGQLDVTQSAITIANLVPGLPAVKFNLEFHATNSPLLAEDLARNLSAQRIELANLTIPSPYEPLRPVAELDSIFVHFTLQGLMNKRIDKIEIVSPTLYVGEDLFWYIDYYRKYVSKGAVASPDGPQMASDDETFALQAASALVDAEPTPAEAAWSIRQLQIHSGKLILAPKGKPLKGFGKPLPFDINTEVVRGTLEAELRIPADVYTLNDYKLQFDGMRGNVRFNLPLKQKDNNLVETFEVDRIRWKELQTGKAFLSITYDAAGIYAKFGAEAYDGYVNGEVNIYNNDTYSWDGWVGGKGVQTQELTKKLFPTYFFMEGNVDVTLVAQGDKNELFQADGQFKNHTPGKFSITALNDTLQSLPGDWTQLEKQLTQIGLETLRDFDYEEASAEFRLYGREGTGKVRFGGPHGSRNFDINVYDHRWTADDQPLTKTE
jgi:hypothetical protein